MSPRARLLLRYMELVRETSRFSVDLSAPAPGGIDAGAGAIVAIHHREGLLHLLSPPRADVHVLVSGAPYADAYAAMVESMGFGLIRPASGSPASGLLLAARHLRSGRARILVLAVDGPLGPSGEAKPGAAWLAKHSGAPIVPSHCHARAALQGSGWDRRILPLPFNDIHHRAGPPIHIDARSSGEQLERATALLSSELRRLVR